MTDVADRGDAVEQAWAAMKDSQPVRTIKVEAVLVTEGDNQ